MNKGSIELIGTFFLVLTIALSQNPFAIGGILMVMVFMGGPISGGHYNPAVTLGVLIRGKLNLNDAVMYWICQLVGAFLAAWVSLWLIGETFIVMPGPGIAFFKATIAELMFTFALVSVVLNVATRNKSAGNSYFGLAIGGTVMAGALAVGPISGGAFNPAVALSPAILDALNGGSGLQYTSIYLIGCLLGGALAGVTFRLMHPDEMSATDGIDADQMAKGQLTA